MTSDFRYRSSEELDAPHAPWMPHGVPGKVAVTSRLPARPMIFRDRDGNGVAPDADVAVDRAAKSSGQALPQDLRTRFESSLGADLSAVRIHTGAESAEAASAVGARAYATGNDIHFAAGTYDPSSAFGVHLLAHEVAHTVQQQGAAPTTQHKLEVSGPADSAEVEADRAADAMVTGAPANVSGASRLLARQEAPAPEKKKAQLASQVRVQKGPITFIGSSDDTGKFKVAAQAAFALPALVIIPPAVSLNGQFSLKCEASGQLSADGSIEAAMQNQLAVQGTINGGIPNVASIYAGVQLAAKSAKGSITRTADGTWDASMGDEISLVGKLLIGIQCELPGAVKEAMPAGWSPSLRLEYSPGGELELVKYSFATGALSAGKDIAAIQAKISSILGEAQDSVAEYQSRRGMIIGSPCEEVSGGGGAQPMGCPEPADKAPLMSPGDAPESCDPELASCEEPETTTDEEICQ